MEIFRLFGTISINKAKAIADIKAVNAAGATFGAKFGKVLTKIAKAGKIIFAGLAIAAGAMFVGAIKKAADFELAMAKVNAITGATAEEFELLTEKAKELGLETAQTMTDIAAGMEAFARAGFNATEIILAMDGAVALAESQVMGLGEAVQITGSVLRAMQLPASEAERVANALAATASSAAVTVSELGESMKYLAPVAAALGMPLEEALTAVGKLGDAGLRGGRATRALATALEGLADPTDEAAAALEKLSIDTFDAEGNFIGIIDLVGQLEESFIKLEYTAEQRMAAMGAIFAGAAGEMNILIGEGRTNLELYQDSITDTTVAFDQQAAMLDTVSGQWQIMKGSIELLLVTIGTKALPVIQGFLTDTLIPWVNRMTEAAEGTSIFETAIKKIIAPFQWMIDNGDSVKKALIAIGIGLAAIVTANAGIIQLTAALAALIILMKDIPSGWPEAEKSLNEMISAADRLMEQFDPTSKESMTSFVYEYTAALLSAMAAMKGFENGATFAFNVVYKELRDLRDEVLRLSPEEIADAWILGVDMILTKYAEMGGVYEALETLRAGFIGVGEASVESAESTERLNTTIDNARNAMTEVNRLLAEYRANQEGAGDDTDETVVAVSALIKEYDDLIIALNATEKGSYEYATALKDLESFHNKLATAAEYLADGDLEVGDALQALIDLTMQYAREQDEATKAAEKGARTMEDLKDAFDDMVTAMDAAEVGSLEWSDALGDVQAQADDLMNQVDFLQEKNIAVSQSIWDQIDALDEQGATIRKTAKETERLAKEQERLEKAQDDARRATEEHTRAVKSQAKELLNLAVTAIKDVVAAYKKMRQEAEDYAQSMRDLQEEFAEREIEDVEDKADAISDEALRHARRLEDIETDYARTKSDIRAEDFEDAQDYMDKLAKAELDYREDKEDALTRHTRELEDIDTAYTEAVTQTAEDRVTALEEERLQFLENKTTIFDTLKELKDKVLSYAEEKIIENWIDGIADSWAGVATESEGAVGILSGFTTTGAPSLVTALGTIFKALVPLAIGLGAFNDQIADANKKLTEFFSSIGLGSETYGPGTWRVTGDPAGGGAAYYNQEEMMGPWPSYDPIMDYVPSEGGATQGVGNTEVIVEINYGGVNVTSQQDAEILARETYELFQSRLRAEGVRA